MKALSTIQKEIRLCEKLMEPAKDPINQRMYQLAALTLQWVELRNFVSNPNAHAIEVGEYLRRELKLPGNVRHF